MRDRQLMQDGKLQEGKAQACFPSRTNRARWDNPVRVCHGGVPLVEGVARSNSGWGGIPEIPADPSHFHSPDAAQHKENMTKLTR